MKKDALNPGKIILVKGEHAFKDTESDNSYEVTIDEVKDAQPYGVFGDGAVKMRYIHELKQYGLM